MYYLKTTVGAPAWLSRLSSQLGVSAKVMTSGSWYQAPCSMQSRFEIFTPPKINLIIITVHKIPPKSLHIQVRKWISKYPINTVHQIGARTLQLPKDRVDIKMPVHSKWTWKPVSSQSEAQLCVGVRLPRTSADLQEGRYPWRERETHWIQTCREDRAVQPPDAGQASNAGQQGEDKHERSRCRRSCGVRYDSSPTSQTN